MVGFALTINNDLNVNVNILSPTAVNCGLVIGSGSVTVLGTANLGTNGNAASYVSVEANGNGATGTATFKGDVNFGLTYFPFVQKVLGGGYIFDGTGTQNVTTNYAFPVYLYGSCLIGNANTPTVIVSDQLSPGISIFSANTNLTVKAGSTLDLTTNTWQQFTAGVGTLSVNGTLKLAAANGGQGGSNFPLNFATNTLAPASTVEYYGTVNQTIFAGATYGNLTLTNNAIKSPTVAITAASNITINPTATFAAGGAFIHNIGGNWINNGTFTPSTSTINFNGSSAESISGSTITAFNNLTINNSSATGVTLAASANVSGILY